MPNLQNSSVKGIFNRIYILFLLLVNLRRHKSEKDLKKACKEKK